VVACKGKGKDVDGQVREKVVDWGSCVDCVDQGRDDSEISGHRLSGPEGRCDSGLQAQGNIRDSRATPRAPAGGAGGFSSLHIRYQGSLGRRSKVIQS
jgi:hypothetical protein